MSSHPTPRSGHALPPAGVVHETPSIDRRGFLGLSAAAAASAGLAICSATAAEQGRDWSGRDPIRYPDPDIISLDPRFAKLKVGNTAIQRIHTGNLWAEGIVWNAAGRYALWSDIPNNAQRRLLDEDGHTSVFRQPAGNSNGNTFDFEGRQLSCEHAYRRVVRHEHSGEVTVLAGKFDGKPFNAPNDLVVHPDGGVWFTDPGYGSMGYYEGNKGPLELKEAVYRIDPKDGRVDKVTDELVKPNGLCFSPDYKLLYIADTGAPSPKPIMVFNVIDGRTLGSGRLFHTLELTPEEARTSSRLRASKDGLMDGIRCDTDGNVWGSGGWAGDGYDGVHVIAPDGKRIGIILLPEIGSNLCFGGAKRNRLLISASQSIYAVYVEARGAHIC